DIGMAVVFEFSNYIMEEQPLVKVSEKTDYQILIYLGNENEENIWKSLMQDFKISPIYVSGPSAFRTAIENKRYTQIFIPDSVYDLLKDILISAQCEDYTYVVTNYRHVYHDYGKSRIIRRPLFCLNFSEAINGTWAKEDYQKSMGGEQVVFPNAKVLVVDDSMVNLRVMLVMLDNYKIKADMAVSGENCLKLLETERYDLILLDRRMPEMDGVETLHKIRQMDGNEHIPVLCITADFGAEIRERLMAEGFQDYLAKPVKGYYLERLLRQYLPEHLSLCISEEEAKDLPQKEESRKSAAPAEDPRVLDTVKGTENIGGNEEAYHVILNTYYREGIRKLEEIPLLDSNDDLSLYITNVHSLKSSSASVGALGISALFKELEIAGKENDRAFLEEHTKDVLSRFSVLLENVKAYLTENGVFESDMYEEERPG
ncbi:MAG TPA: response regulator, partial [Lachnospiraceae bacterium]|nr:response regulator [Lachnospiraceae bacterium]